MGRYIPFFILVVTISLIVGFSSKVQAQIGFPYCEDFGSGTIQSSTILGGSARIVDGVLRLTDAQQFQSGFVYIDIPFPSAFGIKTSFEFFMYGGDGADGFSVFLFDGDTPVFSPGGFGGSLGYAPRNNEPGLSRAYLGIGIDAFGNFASVAEGKVGGFSNNGNDLFPNAVYLRGAGNQFSGYQGIGGVVTQSSPQVGVGSPLLLPAANRFNLSSGGPGTQRVTNPNQVGYRKVFIDLSPNTSGTGYLLNVEFLVTTIPNQPRTVPVLVDQPYNFPAPRNLKIGFAASTGGSTNIHEIRDLQVEVSDQDGLENPTAIDIDDQASCEGRENTYTISENVVVLPNDDSTIRCVQFYRTLDEIRAEEEDVCSQGRCRPENRVLVIPQGTFTADELGGGFTFFPNPGFVDETVEIFYTITDSYGKTSAGNSIRLLIQESPAQIQIVQESTRLPIEQARICEGDTLLLLAQGDDTYVEFEWYFNDVLIDGAAEATFAASEAGFYKVIAFNDKNCPTESEVIEITIPDFPSLTVNSPGIACEIGGTVDLREYIVGYDDTVFDYRALGFDGEFLVNEDLGSIAIAGIYEVQIKNKDLDCWSPSVELEVLIKSVEMNPTFTFEIDGTGVSIEDAGGIFIDDPIRFIASSIGDVVRWLWDFGDGNTSENPSPVHVFGQRGEFLVTLTVEDELGCQEVFTKVVAVTQSYRVMIPTGFTPSLAQNNVFTPKTKGIVSVELSVFNLWGNLIYQGSGVDGIGWDGTVNGEEAPSGTYVFSVQFRSADGEVFEETGKFKLIR
ncbi:MAG: PKD domain-containing protein [Mongoliitalea sp.]